MPVNYNVVADVVDIQTDVPQPSDRFLIDTNVWYWVTYSRASMSSKRPHRHQATAYPDYIDKAYTSQASMYRSELSLVELSNLIERVEHEIFCRSEDVRLKEFRHNLIEERRVVVAEVEAAWQQVQNMSDTITQTIDAAVSDSLIRRSEAERCEAMDLLMLAGAQGLGVQAVVTDDGDFSTVPGITVFTANRNLVNAARNAGKLQER